MNVEPGDLAYIVVPPGFHRTLADKFVTVAEHGVDDMTPTCTSERAARYHSKLWFCHFQSPFQYRGRTVHGAYLLDAWLRPLRDEPGEDVTLAWAPVPAAREAVLA